MKRHFARNRSFIFWLLWALMLFPFAYRRPSDIGGLGAIDLFKSFEPALLWLENLRNACPDAIVFLLFAIPLMWGGFRLVFHEKAKMGVLALALVLLSPLTAFPLLVGCIDCQMQTYVPGIFNALGAHGLVILGMVFLVELHRWRLKVAVAPLVLSRIDKALSVLLFASFSCVLFFPRFGDWGSPNSLLLMVALGGIALFAGIALALNHSLSRFAVVCYIVYGWAVCQSYEWYRPWVSLNYLGVQVVNLLALGMFFGVVGLVSQLILRAEGVRKKQVTVVKAS